ncbi:TPA: hypothetical protein L9K67_005321 [Klebsiella pneumoniae]|nr:hypothetical protein [Klebsiella pneumoniae]
MTTVIIKDALRQQVEMASKGKQTVLYTVKGQPTFMNVIEKFDLSTIDASLSGTHPAFIVNGVTQDVIYIGTYQGCIKNGELLSLPYETPAGSQTLPAFIALGRAAGAGHHIMTAAEWGAMSLLAYAAGVLPYGNTNKGASLTDANQKGIVVDTASNMTYTGTGPARWRHNSKYNGISDVAGNQYEMLAGARICYDELQIIQNNDAAMTTTDLTSTGPAWRAISGDTGGLLAPTFTGTIANSNYVPTTVNSLRMVNAATTAQNYTLPLNSTTFSQIADISTGTRLGSGALALLKSLALFPVAGNIDPTLCGNAVVRNYNYACHLMRGGLPNGSVGSGVFNSRLTDKYETYSINLAGARPCYYKP